MQPEKQTGPYPDNLLNAIYTFFITPSTGINLFNESEIFYLSLIIYQILTKRVFQIQEVKS